MKHYYIIAALALMLSGCSEDSSSPSSPSTPTSPISNPSDPVLIPIVIEPIVLPVADPVIIPIVIEPDPIVVVPTPVDPVDPVDPIDPIDPIEPNLPVVPLTFDTIEPSNSAVANVITQCKGRVDAFDTYFKNKHGNVQQIANENNYNSSDRNAVLVEWLFKDSTVSTDSNASAIEANSGGAVFRVKDGDCAPVILQGFGFTESGTSTNKIFTNPTDVLQCFSGAEAIGTVVEYFPLYTIDGKDYGIYALDFTVETASETTLYRQIYQTRYNGNEYYINCPETTVRAVVPTNTDTINESNWRSVATESLALIDGDFISEMAKTVDQVSDPSALLESILVLPRDGSGSNYAGTLSYGCVSADIDETNNYGYVNSDWRFLFNGCDSVVDGFYGVTVKGKQSAWSSGDWSTGTTTVRSYNLHSDTGDSYIVGNMTYTFEDGLGGKSLIYPRVESRIKLYAKFSSSKFNNVCIDNANLGRSHQEGSSTKNIANEYIYSDNITLCDGTVITRNGSIKKTYDDDVTGDFKLTIKKGNSNMIISVIGPKLDDVDVVFNGTKIKAKLNMLDVDIVDLRG